MVDFMRVIEVNEYTCQRCGAVWIGRKEKHPVSCAKCRNPNWKTKKPKKRGKIGKWSITYNPKPIPDRRYDYDVLHDDYDGENGLFFNASSITAAAEEIERLEELKND